MLNSIAFAAERIDSLMGGSSMPLLVVVPSSPLRLVFSLYVIQWSRRGVETFLALHAMLIASDMFAASPWLSAGAPTFRGRRILLSILVETLTGPRNFAAIVLS